MTRRHGTSRHTKRRGIACVLAFQLLTIGSIEVVYANQVSNEGAKSYREEYEVTAAPMPAPWVAPRLQGCLSGLENVHKNTRRLVAPFAGWLNVSLTSFKGDWGLYLLDDEGQLLAFSNYGWETWSLDQEKIEYFLRSKQEVMIVACNLAGGPTAKVRLELTAGAAFDGERAVRSRTVTDGYSAPSASTDELWLTCYRDAGMGCVYFDVRPGDRRVRVTVSDDLSDPVAAFVYQYNGTTGYGGQTICSRTPSPVLIKPGADLVGVAIRAVGSCGQQKTAGTSGSVTFHISG